MIRLRSSSPPRLRLRCILCWTLLAGCTSASGSSSVEISCESFVAVDQSVPLIEIILDSLAAEGSGQILVRADSTEVMEGIGSGEPLRALPSITLTAKADGSHGCGGDDENHYRFSVTGGPLRKGWLRLNMDRPATVQILAHGHAPLAGPVTLEPGVGTADLTWGGN